MVFRLFVFVGITMFFITMNVLLWRAEISDRNKPGAAVPLEMVWHKITSAPDNSSLEVRHRGRKRGYCRWSPSVGDALASGKRMTENGPPEGMIHQVTGYSVDFDGSVAVSGADRVNFFFRLRLTTNHVWQDLYLRSKFRAESYRLQAQADTEEITLAIEGSGAPMEHRITFEEARNPDKIVRRFGGPFLAEVIKTTGLPISGTNQLANTFGLFWTARHDWMRVGHTRVRVYRLEAQLLQRFQLVVLVSPIGEILRVELPDQIVLMNDALLNL